MSRLLAALKAETAGLRRTNLTSTPWGNVSATFHRFPTETHYRIQNIIGADAWIVNDDPKALHAAIAQAQRALVQAVYGEFRDTIYEMEVALLERDVEKARTALTHLQEQMFGDAL